MLSRPISVLVAVILLVSVGYFHGKLAGRWGVNEALEKAVARVAEVPMKTGEWTAETQDSDPVSFQAAGADAYWTRLYTHPRLRTPMLVILMCGRSGKMSVHTPEVCYRGAGYEMIGVPSKQTIRGEFSEDSLGQFWAARFGKRNTGDERLFWAWSTDGVWQAPESARWHFAGERYLYKMYISHEIGSSVADVDAGQAFLREFLPELKTVLGSNGEIASHK